MTLTPNVSSTKCLARKITPAASKPWKENLRRACLDRAKARRTDSLPILPARLMIDQELSRRSISIHTPCTSYKTDDCEMEGINESGNLIEPEANHYLTEDELFELLADVEQEIELEEARRFEEMIEFSQDEEEYWENQVDDYEQLVGNEQTECVLCPVCQEANLASTSGCIVCPNFMDESCTMRLEKCQQSLCTLQERIRLAYESHSMHCYNNLCFHVQGGNLLASCSTCDGRITIL